MSGTNSSSPSSTTRLTASQQAIWDFVGQSSDEYHKKMSQQHLTTETKAAMAQDLLDQHGSVDVVLSFMRGDNILKENNPFLRLGARCPPPEVQCKSIEFDNIKIYYHPDDGVIFLPQGSYTLYIARPGNPPNQCIDWLNAGITITALGLDNRWGDCKILTVPPSTRLRISYPYLGSRRIQEVVLPSRPTITTPGIPVHVLS
ncbi:hypothetical protein VNI00_018335 [Paramarasmius palmivorus]|uniref:Uncharacterized protein n=1 Tax=Paramarasmius palmivorus TaxID=297713 RepID=A0AAW0B2I4_9AGAR